MKYPLLILTAVCLWIGANASATCAAQGDFSTVERQFQQLPIEARRLTGPLFWLHGDETKDRLDMYVGKVKWEEPYI